MRAPARTLLAVVLAFTVGACAQATQPAATVDGHVISASDVAQALERFEATDQFDQLAEQSDAGTARRQFEQAYLGQQIRRLVLRPRARALGVEVDDEEVDRRLDQIEESFSSPEEFRKALEERGFSLGELAGLVEDQVLEERLRAEVTAESRPDQEELERYYRSHRGDYRQTEARHILLREVAPARALSKRLRDAPEPRRAELFARLARRRSTDDSSARRGGDLGWVSRGELVEPFEAAMDELRIGEVSAPVPTEFGIHVILVTGRRLLPLERVRAQISEQVAGSAAEEAWTEWLADAFAGADIDVNPRYGELDPTTGQVTNATAEDVPGAAEPSPTPGAD
jgi:foldase protein PrsA